MRSEESVVPNVTALQRSGLWDSVEKNRILRSVIAALFIGEGFGCLRSIDIAFSRNHLKFERAIVVRHFVKEAECQDEVLGVIVRVCRVELIQGTLSPEL